MDLTPEQIDQLAALQLRRLEKEYQQVVKADGSMTEEIERARREMGTPNLDKAVQEYLQAKEAIPEGKFQPINSGYEMSDDEMEKQGDDDAEMHSEEEITEYKGFDQLSVDENGYFVPGTINVLDYETKNSKTEARVEETHPTKPQCLKKAPAVTEDPIIVDRATLMSQKPKADPQVIHETFKNINFEAPKWAKGQRLGEHLPSGSQRRSDKPPKSEESGTIKAKGSHQDIGIEENS